MPEIASSPHVAFAREARATHERTRAMALVEPLASIEAAVASVANA